MFNAVPISGKNPYIHPSAKQLFNDAFEDLAKLLNLKKLVAVPDDNLLRIVLERGVITTHGFEMSLTGVMLGVQPYPAIELSVTCNITIAYVLPRLPVRYVTIEGTYHNGWKLSYKE